MVWWRKKIPLPPPFNEKEFHRVKLKKVICEMEEKGFTKLLKKRVI